MHGLVLFVLPRQHVGTREPPATSGDSLVVNLRPRMPPRDARTPSAPIPETPSQLPAQRRPKAPAATRLATRKSPAPETARPAITPPPASPAAAAMPPADMQAYVNAARARRRAAENDAASLEREPSEEEARMALVKRNLNPGTNGVFQILSMESRRATFSFRGWTTDSTNPKLETIQVEIGANSDIEIAIVRKMIELIRKYYQGNFNWRSERLDRVVVLSARQEDNDGLEEFLQREFFGARSRTPPVR